MMCFSFVGVKVYSSPSAKALGGDLYSMFEVPNLHVCIVVV